jgi:hypothetical protein
MLDILFLAKIFRLRRRLRDTGILDKLSLTDSLPANIRLTTLFTWSAVVVIVNALVLATYIRETGAYPHVYWYQRVVSDGSRTLTLAGYYYLTFNAYLMLVSFATIAAHFELFFVAAKCGKAIRRLVNQPDRVDPELLTKQGVIRLFAPISSLYCLSKLIGLTYLLNLYVWKSQVPGVFGLLDISTLILFLAVVVLVSYPRYHIQYWIFELWRRAGQSEYPDVRPSLHIGLSKLIDTVILGTTTFNLLGFVLKRSGLKYEWITDLKEWFK